MPRSSEAARRQALQHDRDRERVRRLVFTQVTPTLIRAKVRSMRAVRRGGDPVAPMVEAIRNIEPVVLQGMMTSDLLGRIRSVRSAPKGRAFAKKPDAFKHTVEFTKERLKLSDSALEAIKRKYSVEASSVIKRLSDVTQKQLMSAVAEYVRKGSHVQEAMGIFEEALNNAGVTHTHPWLIETTVRTQTALSYSAGRMVANDHPAIQEILWGYEYVTVGDDRVREEHAALDGTKLPKDDPRWQRIMPPNGWNCRCSVVEIFDEGELNEPDSIDVDAGWQFNPGALFKDYIGVNVGDLVA